MNTVQLLYLAHMAREKLATEASQNDLDLRVLVGHANLLDNLMISLSAVEAAQDYKHNDPPRQQQKQEAEKSPSRSSSQTRHDQSQLATDDDEDDDSSDGEQEELQISSFVSTTEVFDTVDDEDDYEDLRLVRTTSHHSPPELLIDSDSESDEELETPEHDAQLESMFAGALKFNEAKASLISHIEAGNVR